MVRQCTKHGIVILRLGAWSPERGLGRKKKKAPRGKPCLSAVLPALRAWYDQYHTWPTVPQLASAMQIGLPTLQSTLSHLRKKGIIGKVDRTRRNNLVYITSE